MPDLFIPYFLDYETKDYLWGGTNLIENWNKSSESEKIAETWELSINKFFISKVKNLDNTSLKELIDKNPDIMGKKGKQFSIFPVLIKFINSKKTLSLQVHPDDVYALKNENQLGKSEMWYILEAEKNASIYLGLKQDMSDEEIRKAIQNGKLENYLNKIYVKPGECYYVPSGQMHAIREGVTLIEIQENSNVTYRVFDYNRIDMNGNLRELHIDKAIEVVDNKKYVVPDQNYHINDFIDYRVRNLIDNKYFIVNEIEITEKVFIENNESFVVFSVIEGQGRINGINIEKGETVFLPAKTKNEIKGKLKIITVNI